MQIKLLKLHMQNFKCYKDKIIEFGKKTCISGRNGIGKSTISDAVQWVLFNKMADGQAGKIRPHKSGVVTHFVDIVVELDLEIDGKPVNVKKIQKEKWTKPRGQQEKRFDGNVNEYEVNTIPKTEKQFKDYWDQIISEEVFRYASSASAFMGLKPKDRREKLFELVSDITDEDVLKANYSLSQELQPLLADYSIEELVSRDTKAMKGYKDTLEEIPARIDEVAKTIVDIDVSDMELQRNAILEKIADVEAKEADSNKQLAELDQITSGIMELKFEISDMEKAASEKVIAERKMQQNKLDALIETVLNSQAELKVKYMELEQKQSRFSTLSVEIKEEQKKYADLKSTSYVDDYEQRIYDLDSKISAVVAESLNESTLSCPTCGRLYEKSQIENMKKDFEKSKISRIETLEYQKSVFISENNKLKKHRLDEIIANGNRISQEKKSTETEIENLRVYISQIDSLAQSKSLELKAESELLDKLPRQADMSENQEFTLLQDKLAVQERALEKLNNGQSFRQILANSKKELQDELSEVENKIASADNSKAETRIEELQAEQKDLAQKIADCEKELFLLEQFNKAKIAMLTEEINKHFRVVRFEFWEEQINGGLREVCNATVNGSIYGNGLNSGHSILAEMDIINTMQTIYGVSVPVFLDNSERLSSDNMPNMDCQLIELRVTDDSEMKVEVA